MLSSRENVIRALNHKAPERVPLDLGSTAVSGIAASTLHELRAALGLEEKPVRVNEPFQMLGVVDDDVLDAIGSDVVGLGDDSTFYGFPATDWKPWTLFDGTPVLVPGKFNTVVADDGTLYQYPEGETSLPPSARMPAGGFYHDSIERQQPYDPETLDPAEWVRDMYHVYTDEELRLLEKRSIALYEGTTRAVIGNWGQGGFGDIAWVPGPGVREPKGIRSVADWYMAALLYPEYIKGIYEGQLEIALKNLPLYKQAVGSRIQAIFVSGTDFGSQTGPFISPRAYRDLYKPYHKAINDWIHDNTEWKTFFHTCGSMAALYDDLIEAGVDIVNPVQISAADMAPQSLKERFGDRLVFWGGGIDTQHVLPFGTPEEVAEHVTENVRILSKDGGFVFATVHNVQSGVPITNLQAMFAAFGACR